MRSYRVARRSFLAAVGGAVGYGAILRNMEAAAEGAGSAARFLMVSWPCGSLQYALVPTGTGADYTVSETHGEAGYIIAPFATPELKPLTHIFLGFNMTGMQCPGGGGHEAGTPFSTTGASGPGTRANGGETDDACAGGPSWDQILLKHADSLKSGGREYYNVICDARVDSYETSTRCLSYGYRQQSIESAFPGGMILENEPLLPTLSPLAAYNDLFGGFQAGSAMTDRDALRLLKQRRSVLDHAQGELARLSQLAPANERSKIDAHAEIIRKLEMQLSEQINHPPAAAACEVPLMPPTELVGESSNVNPDYGNPESIKDDAPLHAEVGAAHASIIRSAMACDLIRVGTFEWSPGTNHVGFKGIDPNEPERIWKHHPLSHRVPSSPFYQGPRPTESTYVWDAMVSVQRWYFEHTAKFIKDFLATPDPLASDGGSLLDRTVITMVSEVGNPSVDRNGAAGLIIGGSKLGMKPGGFQRVTTHHNSIWLTTAQPFLGADPLSTLQDEVFNKSGAAPIEGAWGGV